MPCHVGRRSRCHLFIGSYIHPTTLTTTPERCETCTPCETCIGQVLQRWPVATTASAVSSSQQRLPSPTVRTNVLSHRPPGFQWIRSHRLHHCPHHCRRNRRRRRCRLHPPLRLWPRVTLLLLFLLRLLCRLPFVVGGGVVIGGGACAP